MAVPNSDMKTPEFSGEEQEARWWNEHKEIVEQNLIAAMREGTTQQGPAQRLKAERRGSKISRFVCGWPIWSGRVTFRQREVWLIRHLSRCCPMRLWIARKSD